MEQPTVSRFNSQSTSRTLVGDDNGLVSPMFSPLEADAGRLPIVQTPDSKQWVDLDYLSPKILKELRRQYDPSIKDESTGSLAKGAAKVKAWMRQSKLGVEIRLRRKVNSDHDEVTDIHLVPDSLDSHYGLRDEKLPLIAELPATNQVLAELPGEITEMPDTSTKSELSGVAIPSRSSTDSTLGEPLPKYEPPRRREDAIAITSEEGNGRTQSPERVPQASHSHSTSQDSIIATPTRGLSLRDPSILDVEGTRSPLAGCAEATLWDRSKSAEARVPESISANHGPEDAKAQLSEEQKLSQGLQDIIRAIQEQQLKSQGALSGDTRDAESPRYPLTEALFRHLKLANTTTYETETDVEPPSPIRRKPARPIRTKSVALPGRRRNILTSKPANKESDDVDENLKPEDAPVLRKPTLPKRVPASAGAEAVWATLLRMQEKILGPEHPLSYQAKSDLARSRANGHVKGGEDLVTLRRSKQLATETLGTVHPWVSAFSEDLGKLEKLMGPPRASRTNSVPAVGIDLAKRKPADEVEIERPSSSPPLEEHHTILDESHDTAIEPSGVISRDTGPSVPRIVTKLDVQVEPSFSPAGCSAGQQLNSNNMWSSLRAPHQPRSGITVLSSHVFGALTKVALNSIFWMQRNYGPEQPVEPGKVRVRWTCSCGAQLHDDFIERRQGAARELEKYLNRPKTMTGGNGTPTSPASSAETRSFANSSVGPPSMHTSWSSYNFAGHGSMGSGADNKSPQNLTASSSYPPWSPLPEPPWLLTCTNEDRHTPKLAHLDMAPHRVRSDKDLALSLREHYYHVNKKWWRSLRLRGLTTIDFVQFEVHQNRFSELYPRFRQIIGLPLSQPTLGNVRTCRHCQQAITISSLQIFCRR